MRCQMCELAEAFGKELLSDERFELFVPVTLGLACFRLKVPPSPSSASPSPVVRAWCVRAGTRRVSGCWGR